METTRCAVLDIEASGFGRHSYPIEIGYVREDGQAWCSLIHPTDDWCHWDQDAERVHGISRDLLLQHGRAPLQVAQQLNQALDGRTVFCDGWAHDYSWLATLFEAAGIGQRFRLDSIHRLLRDAQLERLDALRAEGFQVLSVDRHRASSDALVLQWALARLLEPQTSG